MDKKSETILSELFRTLGQTVQLRKSEMFPKQGQNLQTAGMVLSGGFKLIYRQNKKVWIKSFVFDTELTLYLKNKKST